MNFSLHQIKKRILAHFVRLSTLAVIAAIVVAAGLASSWYLVEAGASFNTRRIGPWVMWTNAGRTDADPYTQAHFARSGALVLSTEIAHTYVARTDNSGMKLHSSCDYAIEAQPLDASWWSMAVFDESGGLIANPADRHAFTSATIASGADGRFLVTLSREAQPGNWLPTGGAGRLTLVLTLLDPRGVNTVSNEVTQDALPGIEKVRCR